MTAEEARFSRRMPDGDTQQRLVCGTCGHVAYENPKIVVGSVVRVGEGYLLCRRAIEPRRGYWTVPAGYLELNETPEDGARREAREEASAELALDGLLAHYAVPHLSQVQLIYRATLGRPDFAPGPESLEVQVFAFSDIPWNDLAFPTVRWMLLHDRAQAAGLCQGPFTNPDDAEIERYFNVLT